MTWQEEKEKQIADARRHFKDHVARLTDLKGDCPMQVLDWRNADGCGIYRVRYVFDKAGKTITISGDLGFAVFEPTWYADLGSTASIGINPEYFMEKCRATSDHYFYDSEEAERQLEAKFKELREGWSEEKTDKWIWDLDDDVRNVMECFNGHEQGFLVTESRAAETLEEYDRSWGYWLYDMGKHIHSRVWLWLVGLNMAWEQILKERPELGGKYA